MLNCWLIEADAFLGLRKLSLLKLIEEAEIVVTLTEFVARHELSTVSNVIDDLERKDLLSVHAVRSGTPERRRFNDLKRRADKGEAEAIAWALGQDEKPVFVSHDVRARALASEVGLTAFDVLDLAVELVESGQLQIADVQAKLMVWETEDQSFCRPKDFRILAEAWANRVRRRA